MSLPPLLLLQLLQGRADELLLQRRVTTAESAATMQPGADTVKSSCCSAGRDSSPVQEAVQSGAAELHAQGLQLAAAVLDTAMAAAAAAAAAATVRTAKASAACNVVEAAQRMTWQRRR
jgi:hypothetical protein